MLFWYYKIVVIKTKYKTAIGKFITNIEVPLNEYLEMFAEKIKWYNQYLIAMIKKLLCVDDDKITLTLIKLVVSKAAFAQEIITKTNGKEALDYYIELAHNPTIEAYPELIFLDLNMPVMSGWDFLDEFSRNYYEKFSQTKIIILSSSTDPEEKAKANSYPMIIDYLAKPLTITALQNISLN